jgi:trehalose/maltose hydrolase-like predicted phosphorylase
MLEYRYESIPNGHRLASLFGYGAFGGVMFPWTSGPLGAAFGCCSGSGAYEDCLEQHITGDVAFSAWQHFLATGNKTWLATRGWPILQGVADFHLARVTPVPSAAQPRGTVYDIVGVLPVDEWCVGAGCGCETPGVASDAQTNGVAKASLAAAAAAARALGNETAHSRLWDSVAAGMRLLFNTTGAGHHDQFNSSTCPDGWGGAHYSAAHSVCPEDVLYLTYPLGEALATPTAVSRADAELFAPMTCMENAGMTTPIHTIVWLALGNETAAAREFNRSMYAAAYGPFNVRNEVDKHADIVGGHFDNTQFLTGDGGYLQALLHGYGGLRLAEDGLRLLPPHLPESVGSLRLRGLSWASSRALDVTITPAHQRIDVRGGDVCVTDGGGTMHRFNASLTLDRATYAYPGLLDAC